jgi:3-(3-hydroxy-phenyl)propionate hydroxylase
MERLLDSAVRRSPRAEVYQGWQAEAIRQRNGTVGVTIRRGRVQAGSWTPTSETLELEARYLIGADGANSIVRRDSGLTMLNLGFEADWLVVFAERLDPSVGADMPDGAQLLDPARPTTLFRQSGKRFARWEFMLMPGESPEEMSAPQVCWRLIERWGFTPANSRLVRHSVFTFRSAVAENWRAGSVLLAGDAAHLMPPFMGQGMCSGFRDAQTLAWKLDLVLRGDADAGLLDSYMVERRPHVEAAIAGSVRVGELISVTDDGEADRRDALLRAGEGLPVWRMPGLNSGILHRLPDGQIAPPAGLLSIQGQVRNEAVEGLFDDVVGRGWIVMGTKDDPNEFLTGEQRAFLSRIGTRVVQLKPAGSGAGVVDGRGEYARWFDALGVVALVVRPDFYVFGGARAPEELGRLVEDLRRQIMFIGQ